VRKVARRHLGLGHDRGMREPRIPAARVVREPRIPGAAMSGTERAFLIAVGVMLMLLFSVSIVLVHLPSTAAGW
jgi:hypothetical protein